MAQYEINKQIGGMTLRGHIRDIRGLSSWKGRQGGVYI